MTAKAPERAILTAVGAMTLVVVASNVLVQYPVAFRVGALDLAEILTWGAFTYPVAFLVTDLTNRWFGVATARNVVLAGFAVAIVLSAFLSTPRIALASATAYLVGQMADVLLFDRLRRVRAWWEAPLVASASGSVLDTLVFFTLAFAPALSGLLGAGDAFAAESAPAFGLLAVEVPRWMPWAAADFSVKMLFAALLLAPYRGLMNRVVPYPA